MDKEINKYGEKGYIVFSLNIEQDHNGQVWKKKLTFPKSWKNLASSSIDLNMNGLAMETGKKNNIIVIDIDNPKDWKTFLINNSQEDLVNTPLAKTGNGYHYYFRYSDDLKTVSSKTKCFGNFYSIDIRSNGGCIILPPSSYNNNNTKKRTKYRWVEYNIFENDPPEMPSWIKDLLLKEVRIALSKDLDFSSKMEIKKREIINVVKDDIIKVKTEDEKVSQNDKKYKDVPYTINEIKKLSSMLSVDRLTDYESWIKVGLCLQNIDKGYLVIWDEISQKANNYKFGECQKKWIQFKKEGKISIGSLLFWCKNDSPKEYKEFWLNKKANNLVLSKYPTDNLSLGKTKVISSNHQVIPIKSNYCLINRKPHIDCQNSMIVEITGNLMCIKCRHPDCTYKIYPTPHIQLNKAELNVIFNGNVTININNNFMNDEEYVDFQQIDIYESEELNKLIYESLENKPEFFAEIMYYYHKNQFMYAEDDNWYKFSDNIWICTKKKCAEIKRLIKPTLRELYNKLAQYYKQNENDKKKLGKIKQIVTNISDTVNKANILTELSELYSTNNNKDRNFVEKLDSDQNLIGFNNGVYDLKKCQFRRGEPNDYVSMTTRYNYNHEYSDKKQELIQFIEDILPNSADREYFLLYLSHALYGNTLELFTILTGSTGRNGKSKVIELIQLTFGDYFEAVSSSLLTRPRPDDSQPDPTLLNLRKKRIVMASEPEKGCKLNTGFLKFITGRDMTSLRYCHGNDKIKFSPKFLVFLICNDIPDCDDIDNAFSRRLRCINFPTEFVDEPKTPTQKKINPNINQNFNNWKNDFMLLLINYYKKYKETNTLAPSKNILKWTDRYKETTDIYLTFLNECTMESDEDIHCIDLYNIFKEWFNDRNPGAKKPTNKDFVIGIKRYKEVKPIKINAKSQLGIKKLGLKCQDVSEDIVS